MSRGRFITIEGGEGAGKTTQVQMLCQALRRHGIEAVATREPGGAPGAEAIRRLIVDGDDAWEPLAEALLHWAARREHLVRTIRPTLERGAWVVSDRFADSTLAYQGYGQGAPREALRRLYALVAEDFRPDLTILLDLPVAVGRARMGGRGGKASRYERMGERFHERVRRGFLAIAGAEPERVAVIDARADEKAVHAAVWREVCHRLGLPEA